MWLRIEALLPSFSPTIRARAVDVFVSIGKSAVQLDKLRGRLCNKQCVW